MYKNVELRKLPADALCEIVNVLEINDDWKRVMSLIPQNLQEVNSEPKYNNEHIRLIEEYAKVNNQKCTEILIDEWGTSGRFRPTLSHLKNIVIKAEIFRAADEIAKMLNESLPERPADGPAAPITTDVDITQLFKDESMEQRLNNMATINMTNSNKMEDGTTREMKSLSDMIKFSESCSSVVPDNSAPPKSASDLIKFSDNQVQDSMDSMNLPNFGVMLGSKNISQKSTIPMGIDITETHSSITTNTESSFPSYIKENTMNTKLDPNDYQHSFPNIDIPLGIDSAILQDTNLNHFDYFELQAITGNFSDVFEKGPKGLRGKIGSGGFGDVFVGKHSKYGMLAVKKAHKNLPIDIKPDIAMKLFNAEVKYLSQFRHINIVPIIGFSRNGPSPCIVCEYIDGGSLQQRIEAKCLSETERINIMVGTAEGLKYLHTSAAPLQKKDDSALLGVVSESDSQSSSKKFVHGDVKSPNILLTKDCVPKLCDFGVAKQYDATFMTSCFMGTSAYMAPEAIQGTITQKLDIFSYGIVLLELLTGLKPIVVNNGYNYNIKHFVEDNCPDDITPLLDPVVGVWGKCNQIYGLARKCFEIDWKKRPTIIDVCDTLSSIQNDS